MFTENADLLAGVDVPDGQSPLGGRNDAMAISGQSNGTAPACLCYVTW